MTPKILDCLKQNEPFFRKKLLDKILLKYVSTDIHACPSKRYTYHFSVVCGNIK